MNSLYQTFLNRSPTAAEQQYWINQLANQTDEQVIAALAGSAENWQEHDSNFTEWLSSGFLSLLNRLPAAADQTYFQNQVIDRYAPRGKPSRRRSSTETAYRTSEITGFFEKYLGRAPQSTEVQYFLNLYNVGRSSEQIQALILSSPAYFSTSTTNPATWLNDVYQNVLGHSANAAAIAYWSGQGKPASWFYDVALGILQSTEARTLRIQTIYQTYLHHAAGQTDVTYWLSQYQAGLNGDGVQAAILGGDEYFQRPHQYP